MRRLISLILLAVLLLLVGCDVADSPVRLPSNGPSGGYVPDLPPRLTDEASKIAVFENGAPDGFFARNDRGNGEPFNCSFASANAVVADGLLTLSLTKTGSGYAGAEYRTGAKYSFGFYSVSMKATKCSGVISSFFIYTGWPWDEIDIEFLGDDTTKVQFNYFTNGVGGHEYVYELGFDASEDFHEYAFDWQEDYITWYVDGKAVYTATKDIPSHAGNIMMNLWNVQDSHAYWAGKFDPTALPVVAQYKWIGYQDAKSVQDK